MAATLLGSLLVSLGLDSAQFKSGLSDAERRMKRTSSAFEAQGRRMQAAGQAVGNSIRNLAAAAAGGGLIVLLDSFTKLQNNLKVAGLEGEALARVQEKLFGVAQKYGTALESLTGLYGSLALLQQDLGVGEAQLIKLTEGVSQSLKITGTAAAQAGGAILGLKQAFGSARVELAEYNQIIDGGLLPLLQAAAANEKFGGSVNKLRAYMKETGISGKELFDLIESGNRKLAASGQDLASKADLANLTIAQSFVQLRNAMTLYVGEAGQATSVTATLGAALGGLATNFKALADIVLITVGLIGVRWVGGMIAAAASTVALRVASLALIASLSGVAVAARIAGAALLAAFGGPVGVAILAVGAAIYYVTKRTTEADQATGAYAAVQREASAATEMAAKAAERLAGAHGQARVEAIALARAEQQGVRVKLASAHASLVLARAELARARAFQAAQNQASFGSTGVPGTALFIQGTGDTRLAQARANANANEAAIREHEATIRAYDAMINAAPVPAVSAAGDGKPKRERAGRTPRAEEDRTDEIRRRYHDELAGLMQDYNDARRSMAKSADEEAEFELRNLQLAKIRTLENLAADEDYTGPQKEVLAAHIRELVEERERLVEFNRTQRLEYETQQIAEEQYRGQQEALQLQADMADTQAERKRLSLELLTLEHRYQQSMLEAVLASETATDAEKRRAQLALDFLLEQQSARAAQTSRQNETDVERYMRLINQTPEQINEAIDGIKLDGLDALNQGLVDALMGIKSLGDAFRSIASQIIADLLRISIQQAIIKPLAGMLFPGAGIPGFAGGTNFAPGGLALVGERGPEVVNLPRGSQVIPNNELRGMGGRSEIHSPTFVFPGIMNAREAREAAGQAARRYRQELSGPLRRAG